MKTNSSTLPLVKDYTVKVKVLKRGTLADTLMDLDVDFSVVTHLIIPGNTDNQDIDFIRLDMRELKVLDMKDTNNYDRLLRFASFEYCTNLTKVVLPSASISRIGENAFYECTKLTSIDIPSTVVVIDDCAFCGCKGLLSFSIPASIQHLDNYSSIFSGWTSLNSVFYPAIEPVPIRKSNFDPEHFESCILHVPVGTIEMYRNTEGWKDFKNIKDDL